MKWKNHNFCVYRQIVWNWPIKVNTPFIFRTKRITISNFCLGKHLVRGDDLLNDQRGSPAYISPDVLSGKITFSFALSFYFFLVETIDIKFNGITNSWFSISRNWIPYFFFCIIIFSSKFHLCVPFNKVEITDIIESLIACCLPYFKCVRLLTHLLISSMVWL